eukprot:TRINITY_DN11211_c0_g1_i11.p1 TRINITY_DN11211_c0_g1~~TRINITY_DN11211_c0_g1_i11.p1  ORF type:complete len:169 (+),score=12.12 TRINITY_DN11211_c0_g1_i11:78-584(+)
MSRVALFSFLLFFFFNDTATTEIYTRSIVGSVRCVQETALEVMQIVFLYQEINPTSFSLHFHQNSHLLEENYYLKIEQLFRYPKDCLHFGLDFDCGFVSHSCPLYHLVLYYSCVCFLSDYLLFQGSLARSDLAGRIQSRFFPLVHLGLHESHSIFWDSLLQGVLLLHN